MLEATIKDFAEQMEDPAVSAAELDPAGVTGCWGPYNRVIKRWLDFLLALVFLLLLLPVYLVVSAAIAVESGFPVLYRAPRGGYRGRTFRICKFRSMVQNADRIGGGTTALHDSRITRVGGFLRKTKLDETANLLNILKGDMSFIGPRPELLRYTEQYTGTEKLILEVRPGITDFSSIAFINLDELVGSENADEMYETHVLPKKNKLRVKYAAEVSFQTDCKLFFMTVWKVLQKIYGLFIKSRHRQGEETER
ncbi:sugar transferase [Dysosmobacter sp.]